MMVKLYSRNWDRKELARYAGHMDQLAGIKLMEGADGLERGVRMLQVWTGTGLTFNVLADRALDISSSDYKGMSLTWKSPVGDAHPAYYDASGSAWLRSFQGGLLVTCGLDTFGPPNRDEGEDLGQHGPLSNLPARFLTYKTFWDNDVYKLEISGEMRQTRVYGENLVLFRRISTALGSNKIRIEDTVTNEGFSPHPHLILYDINMGFPLLSAESFLKFDVKETIPFLSNNDTDISDWRNFQGPTKDYQERDFIHTPQADKNGWAKVELVNQGLGLSMRISFDTNTLPYLAQWKMMREGIYVLAMQPMNTNVWGGRAAVREQNALTYLNAGESKSYSLEIEVIETEAQI